MYLRIHVRTVTVASMYVYVATADQVFVRMYLPSGLNQGGLCAMWNQRRWSG